MPGHTRRLRSQIVDVGAKEFLGGETITTDSTSQALTIPSDTSVVQISAETAAVYYAINGPIAGPTSPGHVAAGEIQEIGPLTVLTQMTIFGAGAAIAHVQYFRVV